MMAKVVDVAEYILKKAGPMSAMKLQKLVYYSQAWHLVWSDRALFKAPIQAWANGPVVPALYDHHRGEFNLSKGHFPGDPKRLTDDEKDSIDQVLKAYGDKSPQWLSNLTHMEDPWRNARVGLRAGERSSVEISLADMAEYYGSL